MESKRRRLASRKTGSVVAGAPTSDVPVGTGTSPARIRLGKFRSLMVLAAGVACFCSGFYIHNKHEPYENGISTTGKVGGAKKERSGDTMMYSRIFTFTTSNGRKVSVTESESSSTQPNMGATVHLSYLESDPHSARIIPETDWLAYAVTAGGIPFTLAGLANLSPRRRRK